MNELLTKLPDLKQNISLTKDTLHKCYKTLQTKTAEIHHDKSNVKCTPITFLDRYPSKLQIPFTEFVEPRIYNFLNKSNGFYQQYHIHIGKRDFTIHLYLPSENSDSRTTNVGDFFMDCIHKVNLWLRFIEPHIRNNCSMKSTFYLIFTHFQKMIPSLNEPIAPKHVNSAFTTSCSPETSIYIFRYEEWFKVLMHESFHAFGLDFSHHNNSEVEKRITKVFKVNNKNGIRVYEAYCEIWAEVLNIVFLSFLKTKDKKNYLILFDHLLNKELSFTVFQCTKILNHIGLSYNKMICADNKSMKYEETANITSYYFLKLILFLNLRKFESWCKKNNTTLFQFENSNMTKFVDFIIQHSNTPPLQTSLQRMRTFFKRAKLSAIAQKTMRMTILR